MIYELTFKDKIMRGLIGSRAEINPRQVVKLKEKIDPEKLKQAVKGAIEYCPLLGCTMRYNKRYYLETIDAPMPVYELSEKDEPLTIGKDTNGYRFYVGYKENTFFISFCHAVTDGGGITLFYQALLHLYFGMPVPSYINPEDANLAMEDFLDENAEGFVKRKQPKGFRRGAIPYNKDRQDVSDAFVISAPTASILAASKKANASPATIIAPIFCRALRAHMNPGTKNRNVSMIMPIDARRSLNCNTQHNGVADARLTYIDKMDRMDLDTVSTVYRGMLDLAAQPESVMETINKLKKQYGSLLDLPKCFLSDAVYRTAGNIGRQKETNTVLSYLGKANLPREIIDKIECIYFLSWPQFGDSNIIANDFNGTMYICMTTNYKDKNVVRTFMNLCRDLNIDWKMEDSFEYRMPVSKLK